MENRQEDSACCPKFEPEPWQGKNVVFEDKLFIKKTLPQLFHMPIPGTIGRMMKKAWPAIEKAGAKPENADFLWLAHDPSPWKGEHYIHVTREVPGYENVRISGNFITKVFDGPYDAVPKWISEMDSYLAQNGKAAKKYYFYYTTCPECAKKYGHNYVVLYAEV